MNCLLLNEQLDDYLDGRVDATTGAAITQHAADCDDCRKIFDEARQLQALLRDYAEDNAAAPDPEFLERAIMQATFAGVRRERNRSWLKGLGGAIAAGVALFAATLLFLEMPEQPTSTAMAGIPGVSMTLETPQTVNLVFASASELDDAMLTVLLPEGIDIAGFEGQREISWSTSLEVGRNVLPLKLVARSAVGGEVLATLQHEDQGRTFRINVNVI